MASTQQVTGIKAFGAFIPRSRMPRNLIAEAHSWAFPSLKGKGEKAICSWDEDAITMAVEAARDCLSVGAEHDLKQLALASTTAPFADLQNSALIATALQLDNSLSCGDAGGSTRAGLTALGASLDSAAGDALILASDRRSAKPASPQEMQYGSGAAALLTGSGDLIARYLGRESVTQPFVDHFRQASQRHDYSWEERWIRDEGVSKISPATVKTLLKRLGRPASEIAWFGLSGAPVGSDKLVAKQLGIAPERVLPDLQDRVGDTGTAQAPLLLVSALERAKPGDLIVVAAFGQGCEVLAFEMLNDTRKPAIGLAGSIERGVAEKSYLKMLSAEGELKIDWGPRSETDTKAALTQLYRAADQILGFVGGKCRSCGAVQFPRLPNCVQCAAPDSQDAFSLADEKAQIATYSSDWLQYYPAPPLYVGLVQFGVGARVLMEIVDVGTQGIEVGTPLRMVLRVKARDNLRSFSRYFWKAVPAA